jgi:hypothetical protein
MRVGEDYDPWGPVATGWQSYDRFLCLVTTVQYRTRTHLCLTLKLLGPARLDRSGAAVGEPGRELR